MLSLFSTAFFDRIFAIGKIGKILERTATGQATLHSRHGLVTTLSYAIRLASGTLSRARATVVLTGVNGTPVVQDVTLLAVEDNGAASHG